MAETVLITGGAGFIGCYVTRALIEAGYHVRILDTLIDQVHAGSPRLADGRPSCVDYAAEFVHGDVRDAASLKRALHGVGSVIHLAAEVGVGQSMYDVERYVSVNEYGTAALFQQLIAQPVRRVVVASSMSVYGEGLYEDADGRAWDDVTRTARSGPDAPWDPVDTAGRPLRPVPTPEHKRPSVASVYAIGKYVQERLTLTLAPAYGMQGVALRLWNAYGPGQALSNPYTGVLAIFASRIHNNRRPMIFEDGQQQRDFVHVEDVAKAFVLALEAPCAAGQVYNVASGTPRTVTQVAAALAQAMGRPDLLPEVTGQTRLGDVRHNIADIGKIQRELGFSADRDFASDLADLAGWVARQQARDRVAEARRELETRGLVA